MNKIDKEIIHRSLNALRHIPARGNAMSSTGAVQYADQIKSALAIYGFLVYALEENDYPDAWINLRTLEEFSLTCEKNSK
jgi:hypothetical protein